MPREKKPTGGFTAQHARKAVESCEGKKKSVEQEREEKRQAGIKSDIESLPHILETEWIPKIRKAAREGENETSVKVFSWEVGAAGCKLLKKRGFKAECATHTFYGSDDDPGTDWDIIIIKW